MRQKIAEIIENIKEVESRPDYTLPYQVADQILALPITAKFPCPECGGTAVDPDFESMRDEVDIVLVSKEDICPHCDKGQVEKTLVVERWEHCKKMPRCKQRLRVPQMRTCQDTCQWPTYIPLTYATLGEHPDIKTWEWRVI